MSKDPARRSTRRGVGQADGGPITRQRILEVALESIDRDGIDALSMRSTILRWCRCSSPDRSRRPSGFGRWERYALEAILALLIRAGFSDAEALHVYQALFGFLHGHVLNELQKLVERPEETDDLLRLGLHRLPIGDFPLLRGLASVPAAYDGEVELERGLDILFAGVAATLTDSCRQVPAVV